VSGALPDFGMLGLVGAGVTDASGE